MGGMKERDLQESSTKKIIFATFSQAHEGLDIPTLDTVILATPKSDIQQSIGRVMRETKGKKNNPHIYDISDQWSMLTAMWYKRLKVYKAGGFKIHGSGGERPEMASELPQGKCLFIV
jgi:superfamily II DNA or RNA helicase